LIGASPWDSYFLLVMTKTRLYLVSVLTSGGPESLDYSRGSGYLSSMILECLETTLIYRRSPSFVSCSMQQRRSKSPAKTIAHGNMSMASSRLIFYAVLRLLSGTGTASGYLFLIISVYQILLIAAGFVLGRWTYSDPLLFEQILQSLRRRL
jgi:hypothetical protein